MATFVPALYDWLWSSLALAALVMAAVAVVQIARSTVSPTGQLIWALAVLLLPVVGPLAWFLGRPRAAITPPHR